MPCLDTVGGLVLHRGAQIPGARSPWRINSVLWRPVFFVFCVCNLLHVTHMTSNTSRWLIFRNDMQPWYGVKNLKLCSGCKYCYFEQVAVYVDTVCLVFSIFKQMWRTILKISSRYLNQAISTNILIFLAHSRLRKTYSYRSTVFVVFPQWWTHFLFSELCVLYSRR